MDKTQEALKLAQNWYDSGNENPDDFADMIKKVIALAEQPAQQQEPVLWQILNGVCHAGVRSTENLAKEAAAGMQKAHDLGGSLAAFHVRPLYTSPPASKPWVGLTDEEIQTIWRNSEHMTVNQVAQAIEAKLREKNA